ncbi:MAG: MFS transporter [Chlorobi bacterium]|nr:MFS transporter [Chlorobiota bacterium]
MFLIGLMWLVLELTGSKSIMGTAAFVSYIPMLLFGLPAGLAVDTYNRKRLMLAADVLRALVVLVIPVTYVLGSINIPIIILVAFALSSLATIFNPSRDSIVPFLVEPDNLLKANSAIQVSNYIAVLLGPALGAALIGVIGIVHLFTIDSFTFLISFVTILFISYRPKPTETKRREGKLLDGITEALSYVQKNKKVKFLLILTAANNFFIMGPAIVGVPIFVKDVLNEGATSYALVESSYGVGMLFGAFIINYASRRFTTGKLLLLGMLFDGITYSVLYFTHSLYLMIILISFHAIGIPFIVVARTSLIQKWVEDKKLGRLFSLVNMAVVGMTALTTGITGFLAESVPIELIFFFFGIAGTLCGIVGWLYKDLREG